MIYNRKPSPAKVILWRRRTTITECL